MWILISYFNVFFPLLQLLRSYVFFIKCSLSPPFTAENARHPCQKLACPTSVYLAKWAHIKLSFTFPTPKYLLWLDKRWWKLHPRTSNPARHISICPIEDCQKHFLRVFFFYKVNQKFSQAEVIWGLGNVVFPTLTDPLRKAHLTKIEGKAADTHTWLLQTLSTPSLGHTRHSKTLSPSVEQSWP